MLLRYFCLCFIILLCLITSSLAYNFSEKNPNTEIITWIIEDTFEWQDYVNNVPKTTSQETATIIMRGLAEQGYQLNFVKATGDRAEKLLHNEVSACISSRIKNSRREEFSIFSLPHEIYLGQQIYQVAQASPINGKVLNSRGEVISLALLFHYYPTRILAIPSGVSYGIKIDKQIAELDSNNVVIRAGASRIASLMNMLIKSRIDYIISYPQDINIINTDNVSLDSYTIADSPLYFLGHVACSKTTTGQTIIRHIDNILRQAYLSNEFYYAHKKWLLSGDLPKLRQHYLKIFNYLPDTN